MITNLKDLFVGLKKYDEKSAFRIKTSKESFKDITYNAFTDEIEALGTALISKGLKGKHIAIISENRYEWVVSYLAITSGVGIAVPIDRDLPDEAIVYLLEEGDVDAVLYSGTYEEIVENADLTFLNHKICFDKDEDDGNACFSYRRVIESGKKLLNSGDNSFSEAKVDEDDIAGILFTSGTTGFSKGVMLTHKNIASNLVYATNFEQFEENEVMLSILPYHHAFECTVGLLASLHFGATICINDSFKYFAKNLLLFKPTGMFAVPAVVYAMYKRVLEAEESLGRRLTPAEAAAGFGGRLKRIFSGSAPLKPELIMLFRVYGINLCQGYGLTETSPVVTSTKFERICEQNINSVGQVIPGCEVKIVDGEVLVKGENVMKGYYKNPTATAETMENDWFKTGDLGYLDNEGFLYINGRKKNVIIASGGENVYPEEIEQLLIGLPLAADSIVYGGDTENNDTITAVIYPNYELAGNVDEEKIRAIISDGIKKVNEKLPLYKQITAIKIRKSPFEKTTSGKVKRSQANTLEV